MLGTLTLRSFAKVNYTLDVLSPRPDGYHNLASVMQAISLHDTIMLTRREGTGISIECNDPDVPADSSNLAWRAADAALSEAGRGDGIHIQIEKRIPSQAGLGGGSSNAAYTLMGVNLFLDLGLESAVLARLASGLGSDVAFFLAGGTATARGRGESIAPLPDGPPLWFVIVKPEISVSTAWAYRALDSIADRASARGTRRMEEAIREGDAAQVISRMSNDFEQSIFADHMPIGLLHDEFLMARARSSRLCGSGSAVFGLCPTESEANEVARIMRLKYQHVNICRALTRAESLALE